MFCLTSNLRAQNWGQVRYSDAQEHLKKMEQFVGTWERTISKDSTRVWKIIPSADGEGYHTEYYLVVKGKAGPVVRGIIGWGNTEGDMRLTWYNLWTNGATSGDVMKFLTEKKIAGRRYNLMHTRVAMVYDWEMMTPDNFKIVMVPRPVPNVQASQRAPRVITQTWNRVK
jgi:hypothetical protein